MNVRPLLSYGSIFRKVISFIAGFAAVFCAAYAVVWLSAAMGPAENLGAYGEAISFVNARTAEKNLFSENGEADAQKIEEALARGSAALDKASASEMAEAPQYKIDQLKAALSAGDDLLQENKKFGLTMDLGLVGVMRSNAMQTELALLERQQWRSVAELLYMRRYEREYMDRPDDASIQEHHKYGDFLVQEIAQGYLKKSDKEFLTEKVSTYRQNFAAVVESIQKLNALSSTYKEKSASAQKVLAEFAPSVSVNMGAETEALIIGILAVLGLAAVAFAGAHAYAARVKYRSEEKTEEYIKIAEYLESLAAGNTQEDVPFKGEAGEIGKMAAAIAVLKAALLKQEARCQIQEAINQNQSEYEEETAACIDRVVADAEELSSRGQDILQKASEVMKGSLSVSEEIAEANSLVLRLAERVDAVDGSLRYMSEGQTQETTEGIRYQIAEIRMGMNKAISKILHINAAIMEMKGISKEITISAEGQGPATRGVVRGVRYVSSIAQDRRIIGRTA